MQPAATPDEAAVTDALPRWSAGAELGGLLRGQEAHFLVLDTGAERVLFASPPARGLRAGIADPEGRVAETLGLARQIERAGGAGARARLFRLRLDPRGLAAPVTCRAALATLEDGRPALVLAPFGALPKLPPLPVKAVAAAPENTPPDPPQDKGPDGPGDAAPPRPETGRFVWRSDAADVVTAISGAAADLAPLLVGQSWAELFARGIVRGEALAAALATQATFRAQPVRVVAPGSGATAEAELSGMPAARPGQPFAGFAGFGILRARHPAKPDPAPEDIADAPPAAIGTEEPELGAPEIGEPAADAPDTAMPAPAAPESSAPEPASLAAETAASPSEALPEPAASPWHRRPEPPATDLSETEQTAFREIARALGVRFDGELSQDNQAPQPVRPWRPEPMPTALAEVLDQLPAGVLVHRDDTVLFANTRFLGLTGFPDRSALQGEAGIARLFRGLAPSERSEAGEIVPCATADGGSVPLLVERARLDWEGAPAELLLARVAPPSPVVPPHVAESHAAREQALRDVLDSLPDGVLTLDDTARVLSLNRSAAARLRGDPREVVGIALRDLLAPESAPALGAAIAAAERAGTGEAGEILPKDAPGGDPVSLRLARLPGRDAARFSAVLTERGEAKRLREEQAAARRELEASALRKTDFLAKASQEIRRPMTGIIEVADAMMKAPLETLGSERYGDYLRDIRDAGSHVLAIVNDLLELAQIEAGRAGLAPTEIALNDLVSGCIAAVQPQAARERVLVRTSLAPDLRRLHADERSLRQAALTVIANAVRFTEAGGQVIVSTTLAERGEIALRVRDTGIGMTPEEVANALEPFGPVQTAHPGGGSGLGLTLTKAIVEANHGRFRISSRKNEGTLVEMMFPAA